MKKMRTVMMAVMSLFLLAPASAQAKRFSELVGNVQVKPVRSGSQVELPYITWGGDMVTFEGNGGLTTKSGSIFANQGLNFKLVAGDDFVQQVRDYMSGKRPYLRGTYRMIGNAAELLNKDSRTKPIIVLQLTWSKGDHLVCRDGIDKLKDLRGKTVVVQEGGPHLGMLADILDSARLSWRDINVVKVKDLTASANSPAEIFRNRGNVHCATVITPDMLGLTGGSVGTGAEGTVSGAHTLVSTAELSRSIADVYAVRKDWYDANKKKVEKFVAGYLKAAEEVVKAKNGNSRRYRSLLKLTRSIYGNDVIPNDAEANNLFLDCTLVGHQGNVVFFTDANSPVGFKAFNKSAQGLAVALGYARRKSSLTPTTISWQSRAFTGYLTKLGVSNSQRFNSEAVQEEIDAMSEQGLLGENTLYSFTIAFPPNQTAFDSTKFKTDFDEVVKLSRKYGGAVIAVRGHADPTKVLAHFVKAGLGSGHIKRSGSRGSYTYYYNGAELDLTKTTELVSIIKGGTFDGATYRPRELMQGALNTSMQRANTVRDALIKYAKRKGITLDVTQVQAQGAGIRDPLIAAPRNRDQAAKNRRVEFSIVKVSAETLVDSDFDY